MSRALDASGEEVAQLSDRLEEAQKELSMVTGRVSDAEVALGMRVLQEALQLRSHSLVLRAVLRWREKSQLETFAMMVADAAETNMQLAERAEEVSRLKDSVTKMHDRGPGQHRGECGGEQHRQWHGHRPRC